MTVVPAETKQERQRPVASAGGLPLRSEVARDGKASAVEEHLDGDHKAKTTVAATDLEPRQAVDFNRTIRPINGDKESFLLSSAVSGYVKPNVHLYAVTSSDNDPVRSHNE